MALLICYVTSNPDFCYGRVFSLFWSFCSKVLHHLLLCMYIPTIRTKSLNIRLNHFSSWLLHKHIAHQQHPWTLRKILFFTTATGRVWRGSTGASRCACKRACARIHIYPQSFCDSGSCWRARGLHGTFSELGGRRDRHPQHRGMLQLCLAHFGSHLHLPIWGRMLKVGTISTVAQTILSLCESELLTFSGCTHYFFSL